MAFPVVYFEILGPGDLDPYANFYTELFGWEAAQGEVQIPYRLVDTKSSQGINGGIGKHPHGEQYVTFYVQADDLQAVLDKAESLGGKTYMPVREVMEGLKVALFNSPSGNMVGLASSLGGAPERDDEGGKHPVVHFEIAAPDAAAEQAFFREMFGWNIQVDPNFNYGMVGAESGGIAGGVGPHPAGERHVTFYVQCDDLQGTLDKAEQLGGRTVMPVMDVPGGPTLAQMADPVGNMIGLVGAGPGPGQS